MSKVCFFNPKPVRLNTPENQYRNQKCTPPKMMVWKRWLLLNLASLGIYVKFQGGVLLWNLEEVFFRKS